MDITAITPTLPPQAAVAIAPVLAGKTSIPTPSGTGRDSITIGAALSDETGKLSLLSDGSNSIALNTKETDQKLSILADSIGKMKGALEAIKNFPPFPAESSGRKELLMSYASIRKELLQMTVPAPRLRFTKRYSTSGRNCFRRMRHQTRSNCLASLEIQLLIPALKPQLQI